MKSNKLTTFIGDVIEAADRKSPTILTGMAVAGLVATTISMYKAAPKIQEKLRKIRSNDTSHMTKEQKRRLVKRSVGELAPEVLPTVAIAGATAACIIGSNTISTKRIAVLSAAYSIAEGSLKDYKTKLEEVVGDKKAAQVREAISRDKLSKDPVTSDTQIVMTGNGDVLCKDMYSGRFFRSNAQMIGQAINELSADCSTEMYVSLNDWYDKVGLEQLPMGDDLGWNVDDLDHGRLPITISAILTPDNTPCLCVEYDAAVRMDYRKLL